MKNKRLEIERALKRVNDEIARCTDRDSLYSRGMSSEGFSGGYAQALRDVSLVLSGVRPGTRDYWDGWTGGKK